MVVTIHPCPSLFVRARLGRPAKQGRRGPRSARPSITNARARARSRRAPNRRGPQASSRRPGPRRFRHGERQQEHHHQAEAQKPLAMIASARPASCPDGDRAMRHAGRPSPVHSAHACLPARSRPVAAPFHGEFHRQRPAAPRGRTQLTISATASSSSIPRGLAIEHSGRRPPWTVVASCSTRLELFM